MRGGYSGHDIRHPVVILYNFATIREPRRQATAAKAATAATAATAAKCTTAATAATTT